MVLFFECFSDSENLRESFIFCIELGEFSEIGLFTFFVRTVNESTFIEEIANVDCYINFFGKSIGEKTMIVVFIAKYVWNIKEGIDFVEADDIAFAVCDNGLVLVAL